MTLELCLAPALHWSRLHQSGSTDPSGIIIIRFSVCLLVHGKAAGSFQTNLRRSCRLQVPTSVVFNSDAGEPVRLDPQPPDFSGQALKTSFHISCLSKHHFAPMPGLQLSTLNSVMSILQLSWITSSFPHKSWPSAITYHFHCSQFFAIFRHGSILGKWQYFTNLNQLWGWFPLINHDFQRSVAVRSL